MGKRRSGRYRGSASRPSESASAVDVTKQGGSGIFGILEHILHIKAGEWKGLQRASESLSNTFTTSDSTWVPGDTVTFSKTAGAYTFPVRNGKVFRIALYGASGGGMGSNNSNGATLDVAIDLTSYQNTNLYFYVGGQGSNSSSSIDQDCGCSYPGGYNGGGYGCGSRGPGGGGRTDLRTSSGSSTSELLVAAGGGGGFGTQGSSGSRVNGSQGCSGWFGSYCGDNGGGGGGYYGGAASCSDDGSNGGSGTNYYNSSLVSTVYTNTTISGTSGGNSGNGYFTISVVTTS